MPKAVASPTTAAIAAPDWLERSVGPGDQAAVDLQDAGGQRDELPEGGEAVPEVVDRHLDARDAQLRELGGGALRVLRDAGLGELHAAAARPAAPTRRARRPRRRPGCRRRSAPR